MLFIKLNETFHKIFFFAAALKLVLKVGTVREPYLFFLHKLNARTEMKTKLRSCIRLSSKLLYFVSH